jgi:hypothetical protein
MSVINRRNAVLGWATWNVGKRVIKKKAKDSVPSEKPTKKRRGGAVLLFVVSVVGALAFWKKRSGGDDESPDESG